MGRVGLALATTVLLVAAFPAPDRGELAWIALVPLALACRDLRPVPAAALGRIPDWITEVLDRTPRFRGVRRLRTPEFWQPQFRAYSTLDFAGELTKAAAWCEANPRRAPKRDLPRFLHAWFRRAAADDADASDG
jgi:hypothetical protein